MSDIHYNPSDYSVAEVLTGMPPKKVPDALPGPTNRSKSMEQYIGTQDDDRDSRLSSLSVPCNPKCKLPDCKEMRTNASDYVPSLLDAERRIHGGNSNDSEDSKSGGKGRLDHWRSQYLTFELRDAAAVLRELRRDFALKGDGGRCSFCNGVHHFGPPTLARTPFGGSHHDYNPGCPEFDKVLGQYALTPYKEATYSLPTHPSLPSVVDVPMRAPLNVCRSSFVGALGLGHEALLTARNLTIERRSLVSTILALQNPDAGSGGAHNIVDPVLVKNFNLALMSFERSLSHYSALNSNVNSEDRTQFFVDGGVRKIDVYYR